MFAKRIIRVNGIDVDLDASRLLITDIDDAQRKSASEMAFWASVNGAAEREMEEADAYYRHWRAKAKLKLMEADPKQAEHKLNAQIESHADFCALKQAIAKAAENVRTAQGMYGAWEKRVNAAQSLGARERGEREAFPKSVTRDRPREAESHIEEDQDNDSSPSSLPRRFPTRVGGDGDKRKLKDILKKGNTNG